MLAVLYLTFHQSMASFPWIFPWHLLPSILLMAFLVKPGQQYFVQRLTSQIGSYSYFCVCLLYHVWNSRNDTWRWQMFPLSNLQERHNPHPDSTISLLRGSNAHLVLGNAATFFISLNSREQTSFSTLMGRVGRDEWYGQCRVPIVSQRHGEAAFLAVTHVLVRLGHCPKIQGRFWVAPSFKIVSPKLQGTH